MTIDSTDERPSESLAEFVAGISYGDLPDDAIRIAERCFVDTVGVTLPGARARAGETATAYVRGQERGGDATLLGRGESVSLPAACFANGTAGHALDFDDVSLSGMSGHPSVTMVAPILATAEARGASGREAITAFVAGFETQCYLAAPISPAHYERGWHATGTFGTFGAAAAVASLLDLDRRETRHALNAAASMAAGLKRNFGSTTKPVHVGQAAQSGAKAALLAAEGCTADPAAVGGDRGFLDLYGGGVEPDRDAFPALGDRWAILEHGVSVKKYPCCYYTHSAIAEAASIGAAHDLDPGDVESVSVTASPGAGDALAHDDPGTGLEAKFSMPYTVAYALVRGTVDLEAFADDVVGDPQVQRVRERTTLTVDPDLEYGSNAATVAVRTVDGDRHESFRERPPGTPAAPLSRDQLREKFLMCADASPVNDGREAVDLLGDLRRVDDVADILARL